MTEKAMELTKSRRESKVLVGGFTHTVCRLEGKSYKVLPGLLKRDIGIEKEGRLKRDFIEIGKNRYIEVNI